MKTIQDELKYYNEAAYPKTACSSGRRESQSEPSGNPLAVKTAVCVLLFAAVLAIKNFGGQSMEPIRQALCGYLANGADYSGAVQAIGAAVADNDVARAISEQAVKVFGMNLLIPYEDAVQDETEPDAEAQTERQNEENAEALQNDAVGVEDADVDGAGAAGEQTDNAPAGAEDGDLSYGQQSAGRVEPLFKNSDFDGQSGYVSTDAQTVKTSARQLKSAQPLVISAAEELEAISALREEVVDNTPATEFGQQLPSVVDAGVYELPFKFAAPRKGRITSPFGYRIHPITGGYSFHYGVDISASKGDKICAFAEGTVIETGTGKVYGKYVKIQHKDGYWTRYCHLNKISVKKGQKVKLSQKVGEAGTTGMSTGVHLHFELRRNDKILNPSLYVKF